MNANYLSDLADCLTTREETTLGLTDSRVAAAALRVVAALAADGAWRGLTDAVLRQELTGCVSNDAGSAKTAMGA